jgi:hypothetical protein
MSLDMGLQRLSRAVKPLAVHSEFRAPPVDRATPVPRPVFSGACRGTGSTFEHNCSVE